MQRHHSNNSGFSLVEVLVAATTLVVALSGLAQLLTMAAVAARRAQTLTLAAVYAAEKLESLVPRAALDAALSSSPSGTLTQNVDGYCEFLDAAGAAVGSGTTAPADAAYVRRWSIESVATGAGIAVALQVVVADGRYAGIEARTASVVRYVP